MSLVRWRFKFIEYIAHKDCENVYEAYDYFMEMLQSYHVDPETADKNQFNFRPVQPGEFMYDPEKAPPPVLFSTLTWPEIFKKAGLDTGEEEQHKLELVEQTTRIREGMEDSKSLVAVM